MGLCKCPKKKVTNLFCFEHRVNVCEHCLVSNHPKCIVQSYLQWLQDSDYDPTCRLCGKKLTDDDNTECVRLICYDVFHWSCLDHYARQLPPNTAPAGYTCPICKSGIFPAHNVVSPVADVLRQILIKVNWARVGLGLPLIEEPPPGGRPSKVDSKVASENEVQAAGDIPSTHKHINTLTEQGTHGNQIQRQSAPVYTTDTGDKRSQVAFSGTKANIPDSVVTMDSAAYVRTADKDFLSGHPADPRKMFDSTKGAADYINMSHDHDDDKYKRRPALQWFARWFSSRNPRQRRDPHSSWKRIAVIVLLVLIAFFTMIVIFSKLGRASADNDPFLNPLANPHIQIQE
ncbi:hypothetical protein LSH36_1g12074 [Paralvinella palmiformis]|uniref:RING-type domain-containing protein n=1 Tax=Paralvinella palmiformis TaxID=53620 RepID=A0AAD9KG59_9ANNE|nr:hypothetical protein LSH36_1g12074 [Paralvinella palmiformis]